MSTIRFLACVAALCLSACGGGGDDEAAPTAPADTSVVDVRTVSAVIDPAAGGALRSDGLALEFPAAALGDRPQTVALVTRSAASAASAASDTIASFRLEPAGAPLRQPVTLSFTAAAPLPPQARLFWNIDGVLTLMPGLPAGNTLSTTITSLGYAAGGSLQAQGAAVGRMQRLGVDSRERALAETTPGGNVEVRLLQCQSQIASLNIRLASLDREADAGRVTATYDEALALRQSCDQLLIESFELRSCEALSRAIDNATLFAADSFANFKQMAVSLFGTTAMVHLAGATCASAGGVDPQTQAGQLLASKFDQFLTFLDARVVAAGFADEATTRDLGGLFQLDGICQRLALDSLCGRFSQELYPRALDILRRIAFDACRVTGAQEVTRLHELGLPLSIPAKFFGEASYSVKALEADAVYCTNPGLSLKVFENPTTLPEEIVARAKSIDALGSLGDYNTRTSIKVPPTGSLSIAGRVRAMRCADGTQSNDRLEFRLSGQELARYARAGDGYTLATQPLDFLVERDLARLGLPAVNSRTLTLVRVGGGCEVGEKTAFNDEFTLFTVTLDLTPPVVEPPPPPPPPPPPAKWAGSVSLDYRFTVNYDEARSASTGCGFVSAPCEQTSRGSYTGAFTYSLTGTTPGEVTIGAPADLAIGVGTTRGTLSSTGREFSTATRNGCTTSTDADVGFTAEPVSAVSQGLWNLQVSDQGLLEIGTNVFRTTASTFRTGRTILTTSSGCSGGASSLIVSDRGPGDARNVSLTLGIFRGTVDPSSNVWAGGQTLTFTGSGGECEQFIIDTPAKGAGAIGVSASTLTCSATLRGTWNLGRQ